MSKSAIKKRNEKGSHLAEFPVALGFLVCTVFFVLIDVSTLLLGANNVHNAARTAAVNAAKAAGYQAALSAATETVNSIAGGVSIQNISVVVFEIPVKANGVDSDGNALKKSQILPSGTPPFIDTSSYQYQVQVAVTGSVTPLANLSFLSGLADVPGLTGPLVVTGTYSSLCENPNALAK